MMLPSFFELVGRASENRQKAIGTYVIWISGSVKVSNAFPPKKPEFNMKFKLHAEDQYNFNPGQKDITTGTPDSENGRFVVVGLAHGYKNTATLNRSLSWIGYELGVASTGFNIRINERPPQH